MLGCGGRAREEAERSPAFCPPPRRDAEEEEQHEQRQQRRRGWQQRPAQRDQLGALLAEQLVVDELARGSNPEPTLLICAIGLCSCAPLLLTRW